MLINKHTLIYTQLHSHPPIPPGRGPMGVCTEIGHLSHMMSRGRGCIIDEPKQHVSVSTQHTADAGGSSRRWAERGGNSSGRGYLDLVKSDRTHICLDKIKRLTLDKLIGMGGSHEDNFSLNCSINPHEIFHWASNLLFTCLHLTLQLTICFAGKMSRNHPAIS